MLVLKTLESLRLWQHEIPHVWMSWKQWQEKNSVQSSAPGRRHSAASAKEESRHQAGNRQSSTPAWPHPVPICACVCVWWSVEPQWNYCRLLFLSDSDSTNHTRKADRRDGEIKNRIRIKDTNHKCKKTEMEGGITGKQSKTRRVDFRPPSLIRTEKRWATERIERVWEKEGKTEERKLIIMKNLRSYLSPVWRFRRCLRSAEVAFIGLSMCFHLSSPNTNVVSCELLLLLLAQAANLPFSFSEKCANAQALSLMPMLKIYHTLVTFRHQTFLVRFRKCWWCLIFDWIRPSAWNTSH